jgi:hypothetical protein
MAFTNALNVLCNDAIKPTLSFSAYETWYLRLFSAGNHALRWISKISLRKNVGKASIHIL